MPGDDFLAALPGDPDEARMKRIFRNNCTSCHTPSYTLQHRFDETGWNAIIEAMKNINVYGAYRPGQPVLNKVIDHHQKELAAYLAKVRGPGGQFKITTRARPTGEAARVVFKEYEVPLNQDQELASKVPPNNGSDWTLGTTSRIGSIPHDAAADNDGNLWYASVSPNHGRPHRRQDRRGQAVQGQRAERAGRALARPHPRRRRRHLVQRARLQGRARQGRSQDREGLGLYPAVRHVADRRPGDARLRRHRRHLGRHYRWGAAVRSEGGEVHRVQVGDAYKNQHGQRDQSRFRSRSAPAMPGGP